MERKSEGLAGAGIVVPFIPVLGPNQQLVEFLVCVRCSSMLNRQWVNMRSVSLDVCPVCGLSDKDFDLITKRYCGQG